MSLPFYWIDAFTDQVFTGSPAGVDTLRLHADALRHRINTAPGLLFSVKDRYRNCLRMNCGIPWSPEIDAALKTLGGLAKNQL